MKISMQTLLLAVLLALSGCATVEPRSPRIERLPEGAAGPIAPVRAQPLSLAQVVDMARSNTPANVIIQSLRDSRATYAISASEANDLAGKGVPYEVVEYLRHGERPPVAVYPSPVYSPYRVPPGYYPGYSYPGYYPGYYSGYRPGYFAPGWGFGAYSRYPRSGIFLQFGLRR